MADRHDITGDALDLETENVVGQEKISSAESIALDKVVSFYKRTDSPFHNEIGQLLLKRVPKKEIAKYCAEKYEYDPKTVYRHIQTVLDSWLEESKVDRDHSLAKALLFREYLIREALKKDNLRFAFEVQQDLDKINGIYEKEDSKNYTIVIKQGLAAESDDGPVSKVQLDAYKKETFALESPGEQEEIPDAEFEEGS